MKKIILASALVLASTSVFAAQSTEQKGGFTGPSAVTVNTVQVALDSKDDTPVTLTGYILSALGDEEYKFSDDTGEIIIEIDNRDWNGIEATPETQIVIQGEVDSNWSYTTIDVNSVQLAK
ncbi:NirD/YgiW/YdeI family stress tolerance protein [Shewanella sp. D64]|uniref:YgiW/YdeI family stress tolerance OB fold protein n=1 Tax=unclassified Shewanella TaxID=196818 RepID=UPI0022BA3B3A|nr:MULTISPECIES: NirD/YgiW/YdeI family stress tolerance protein [unclassified Shewanella]MEC4727315.1 NirD/YgiW/YdeI family stress tolerance protein [Shewanella sp. D64]MEC4739470.1 NirD/YgiW/YdeI family stress tolerance protein [Shewanella sp. E94]WBJ96799.1 NirD/YgiW/YdeI family stress tolerance protein [Shewanella sp. MTB7]